MALVEKVFSFVKNRDLGYTRILKVGASMHDNFFKAAYHSYQGAGPPHLQARLQLVGVSVP